MNIIVTPETDSDWSTIQANNLNVGTVVANNKIYMFYPNDAHNNEFSNLELAEIRHVGRKTATALTVTQRLKFKE